jgi:hypothetical protein
MAAAAVVGAGELDGGSDAVKPSSHFSALGDRSDC